MTYPQQFPQQVPYAPPQPPQAYQQPAPYQVQQPAPYQVQQPAPYQVQQPAPYAPPQAYQQPPAQPPAAQGTLSDFYNQRSAATGKGLRFPNGAHGTNWQFRVARTPGPGDVQQVTDVNGRPQTFKDNSPKWQMLVPVTQATCNNPEAGKDLPDGDGTWYVKGQMRDELARAIAEAGGDPNEPPQAGAWISVTYVRDRPSGPGMNPAKIYQVQYVQPEHSGPLPASAPTTPAAAPQQPQQPGVSNVQQWQQPAQQAYVTSSGNVGQFTPTAEQIQQHFAQQQTPQQFVPQAAAGSPPPAQQPAAQQFQPQPGQPGVQQPLPSLDQAQAAMMARLAEAAAGRPQG
jgi:hypothetical protein